MTKNKEEKKYKSHIKTSWWIIFIFAILTIFGFPFFFSIMVIILNIILILYNKHKINELRG